MSPTQLNINCHSHLMCTGLMKVIFIKCISRGKTLLKMKVHQDIGKKMFPHFILYDVPIVLEVVLGRVCGYLSLSSK